MPSIRKLQMLPLRTQSDLNRQHFTGEDESVKMIKSSGSSLITLSNRGTLILEAALKGALQALEGAVREQSRHQHECQGCVPCLFPECTNMSVQCRAENYLPATSEPSCEVILAAQNEPDPVERSWALSRACSFFQRFCAERNQTGAICIQATAGHCHLRLQECKLESDMDYLNTSPEEESPVTCGQKVSTISNSTGANGRIVGGSITSPGSWPWLVNIRFNGEMMCGGVLLGYMWVLTAAHCFTGNLNELHWTVVVGQYDLTKQGDGENIFQVNSIVTHPKFNQKTFNNDLALLELTSSVTKSERARPVCLPAISEHPAAGTNCYITGWGSLYEDGPPSDVVMEARVPVLSQEACKGTLGKDMLTNTMFCAGYLTGGIDSCQGDSGGPLTCQDPASKQYVLYGITSWGDGCGERGKPGVYTRVTAFTDWITLQMKKSFPSREPTCFEFGGMAALQENTQKSELSRLCSFYRKLCPAPLSQEACTHLAEEKCKQKQKRCELRSYLQTLLTLLRRAEEFLRHNVDFSFFTQTIPQVMEQMYSNVFPSRVRRNAPGFLSFILVFFEKEQILETETMEGEIPQELKERPDERDWQTGNDTESTSKLQDTAFESLFQDMAPGLEDWVTLLHKMSPDEATRSLEKNKPGNENLSLEKQLFLQGNDNTVKDLETQGWRIIHRLKSQLRSEGIIINDPDMSALDLKSIPDDLRLQKREVKSISGDGKANVGGCLHLEEANRQVQAIKERYRWILQVPERELSMDFQEILVDMGSKNGKGLYRARVRVRVAGKYTSFISLVGLENSSFYRSMPGLIALSMDVLKT
ncbi:serine protease 56 [Rhinophrynus dorsalis]